MAKPWIHALSSAKKWGGDPEDYFPIHDLMDSSKGSMSDNRHRALTHNSWFLSIILEKIFDTNITNSEGKLVSVRDIGEQHILEDFGGRFIPTASDYLQEMEYVPWMNADRNSCPNSHKKISSKLKVKKLLRD
jgi:hypothetical protein